MDDATLDRLGEAADGRARLAEDADAVAGVRPRYVVTPASTAHTSAVLHLAAEENLRVVVRGGGSKQHWAAPPTAVDVVLDTTGMGDVVEHAAGDLIAVAAAGTRVDDLAATLAAAGQQLALDNQFPTATLGGAVATAASGPRRLLYGTLRDLVIGVTFVRADGVVAKAGGKVVKNVAGYDFGKLLTGSFGTLGVITSVALRLHPLPRVRRYVVAGYDGATSAGRAAAAALGSQAVPSAVEIDAPASGAVEVAVLVEGVEAGVAGRTADLARLLDEGATDGAATLDEAPPWFGAYPLGAEEVALKVSCPITEVPTLIDRARELGMAVRGSAMGVLYATPAPGPADLAATVASLREHVAVLGGHVVVLGASAADGVEVWGPVPGLALMRRVKQQLDPAGILAPGRFVGGI